MESKSERSNLEWSRNLKEAILNGFCRNVQFMKELELDNRKIEELETKFWCHRPSHAQSIS